MVLKKNDKISASDLKTMQNFVNKYGKQSVTSAVRELDLREFVINNLKNKKNKAKGGKVKK
jgi:hypothetical protein